MVRIASILFLICEGFCILSCGGGGGGGGNQAIPPLVAPTNLTIDALETRGEFQVTWTPPQGSVDSVELEGSIGNSPFTRLPSGQFGPFARTTRFRLDPDLTPEETPVKVRIRSIRGSEASAYSPEAMTLMPLIPPSGLGCWDGSYGGIELGWDLDSKVATGVILERSLFPKPDSQPTFEIIFRGSITPTLFKDFNIKEDTLYLYRICFTTPSQKSAYVQKKSILVPINTIKLISVEPRINGCKINWENFSTKTTSISVYRSPRFQESNFASNSGELIANLAPTATAFTDTTAGEGPFSYTFKNQGGSEYRFSRVIPVVTVPHGTGPSLAVSTVELPSGNNYAKSALGWFSLSDDFSFVGPNGTFKIPLPPSYTSKLVLDKDGYPHILIYRGLGDGSNMKEVVHGWLDISGLHLETIATLNILRQEEFFFTIDNDKNIHCAWIDLSALKFAIKYGIYKNKLWVEKEIEETNASAEKVKCFISSKNEVFVTFLENSKLSIFSKNLNSTDFSKEQISLENLGSEYEFHTLGAKRILIYYPLRQINSNSYYMVSYVMHDGTSWSQTFPLGNIPIPLTGYFLKISATSANEGKISLLVSDGKIGQLFSSLDGKSWTTTIIGPNPVLLNFDSTNRLLALTSGGYIGNVGFETFVTYQELQSIPSAVNSHDQ